MLQMIWKEKWEFNYRWMKKVKFENVYVDPVKKKGHVHTDFLWAKVTYIIWTMEIWIIGVITMVISNYNWGKNVYSISSTNTNDITKGFNWGIDQGKYIYKNIDINQLGVKLNGLFMCDVIWDRCAPGSKEET